MKTITLNVPPILRGVNIDTSGKHGSKAIQLALFRNGACWCSDYHRMERGLEPELMDGSWQHSDKIIHVDLEGVMTTGLLASRPRLDADVVLNLNPAPPPPMTGREAVEKLDWLLSRNHSTKPLTP